MVLEDFWLVGLVSFFSMLSFMMRRNEKEMRRMEDSEESSLILFLECSKSNFQGLAKLMYAYEMNARTHLFFHDLALQNV